MDRKRVPGVLVADITGQDIEEGTARDCKRCPGALALMRALRELGFTDDEVYITVGHGFAALHLDDDVLQVAEQAGIVFYPLPLDMQSWIENFDSDRPVQPAAFTLIREVTA